MSETMVKHEVEKVENPIAKELKAKVAMYEKEIEAHKLVGSIDVANAIQKEVDNLKFQASQYS